MLQNIRGDGLASTPRDPPSQASRAIQKAEQLLREQGASFIHVLRTWFYLSQILSWYPDFNGARNVEYRRFGLLGDENARVRVPASTGIRAELSGAAACSLDLIAHLPRTEAHAPSIRTLENPGQQSAFRYGSAFSRAVAIESEQELMIQVSGTAAIDEAGKSLFAGDIRAQIACTLDKVEALLAQERVSVREICAATLFVKQSEHAPIVREVLQKRGLDGLPAVCVVADICREELLFEMDAEILAKPR